jgi:hypothetical protein
MQVAVAVVVKVMELQIRLQEEQVAVEQEQTLKMQAILHIEQVMDPQILAVVAVEHHLQ